jgi:hypothetical protein
MRITIQMLALGAALSGMPAMAAPAVDVRLPVIAAKVQQDRVAIRLVSGLGSHGPAAGVRSVTIEAYDASGKRVAESSLTVSRRLTYAYAPLSPAMQAADRIVVTSH